jgi:hypothetical protein
MHRDSETAFFDVSNPVLAASATWILPDLNEFWTAARAQDPVEANAIPAMLPNNRRRCILMMFHGVK